MAKGLILYKSKYGATKKYAGWLAEMTGFDCEEIGKQNGKDLLEYGALAVCGGIYASGISGVSFLKKNYDLIRDKRIAVLCVGASPYDEKSIKEVKERNLPGKLSDIPMFYVRGAWDEKKMSFKDRTLCNLLKKSISKIDPSEYEPWMAAIMSVNGESCDWSDKKHLEPLVEYLKG